MDASGHNGNTRVRSVLKDHGLRYSRPREVILGYLLEGDKHVSAEGLYLELKHRGVDLSLSTVYLNLSVLAGAGLVREFKGASGQSLYDSNVSPHYHVVCRETGEILDVPTPTIDGKPLTRYLKETVEASTGWIVDEPRLSLSGVSPRARGGRTQDANREARDRTAIDGAAARDATLSSVGVSTDGAAGADAAADDAPGDDAPGEGAAGADAAGESAPGEGAAGEDAPGEGAAGEDAAGDDAAGDHRPADRGDL